ncbi:MAG: hypothetical protein SOW92_08845 [Kiritimatiellia bacterium]|nr:hypothetical protein [Kiritimatiellia bacterium]
MNFPYESLAYKALPIIMAMLLPSISLAQRITTDAPVLSSYADTEATTNVVFSAGDTDDRLFRLSLELNATADNNVSVVFGTDANANGVLDREEADAVVGWDSGSWFYQDRVSGAEAHTARTDGRCRLNWELTLNPHKAAKSIKATDANGVVFKGAIPAATFNPAWNLMQVTARGLTEPGGIVVNEVLGRGFNVILR